MLTVTTVAALKKAATNFLKNIDSRLRKPAIDSTPNIPQDPTIPPPSDHKASSRPRPLPQRAAAQEDKSDTNVAASELFRWYIQQWSKKL